MNPWLGGYIDSELLSRTGTIPHRSRPICNPDPISNMNQTIRIVTRGSDGELRKKEYPSTESLLKLHTQIGVDDCSTNLSLRGLPVFRGLIGPMPDGKGIVRYESPEVFETLTKEWGAATPAKRRRRRATT